MTQTTSRLTKSSVNIGTLTIDDNTTVGQLATAILANNESFEEYDQLTCFIGSQSVDSVTRTPRATIKGSKIVLDTNGTTVLWNVVDRFGFSTVEGHIGTENTVHLQTPVYKISAYRSKYQKRELSLQD